LAAARPSRQFERIWFTSERARLSRKTRIIPAKKPTKNENGWMGGMGKRGNIES
jgi:hypothetical protein